MTDKPGETGHEYDQEVEAQLDEVMDTIRSGALPWQCDEATLDELRDHYRPGFTKEKENWRRARPKIIRLSKYEGALAALLAEVGHAKLSPPPYPIPRSCMWLAAFLVQLGCPPHNRKWASESGDTVVPFGPHCPGIVREKIDGALVQELQGYLLNLLTRTGIVVQTSS